MLNPIKALKELHKQNYLSEWISISDILPDYKTCVTQSGSLVQVIKLEGRDYSSLTPSQRENFFSIRKNFFEKIDDDLLVSVMACRRKVLDKTVVSSIDEKYAQEIASKMAKEFTVSFETEIYVIIKKKITSLEGMVSFGSKEFKKEHSALMGRASSFSSQVDVLKASLERFKPTILQHNPKKSDLLAFWSYLLNGGIYPKATTNNTRHLNHVLGYTDVEFIPREPTGLYKGLKEKFKTYSADMGLYEESVNLISQEISKGNNPYIRFSAPDQNRFAGVLFLKYFPQVSEDTYFDDLMALQNEFIYVQHFEPSNKEVVLERTNTVLNQLYSFGRFAGSKIADLEDYADAVSSDDIRELKHSMNILVFGESTNEVDDNINAISTALSSRGINLKREEGGVQASYWSMLPDYEELSFARKVPVSSETCADFCNFGAKPFGNTKCSFGDEPVSMFKTTDGQSYGFTFHPTEDKYVAGHTLIVGSTGSGKTLTSAYLLSQCLKFNGHKEEGRFKALIFDSLNGLKVPVKAFGGDYVDINDESGFVPLNPLQMPDKKVNRDFLERWVSELGGGVTDKERDTISRAIRANYDSFEDGERSLNAVRGGLGIDGYTDDGKPRLLQKLSRWMPEDSNGNENDTIQGKFFNAKEDALKFSNQLIGFDLTFLKDNDELLVPLTDYLFHRFTDFINDNPCPHLWFIDEAVNFVENKILYPKIKTALKEWRKRNGVVVSAVQDLETLNSIDVGQEFIQSFQTYIIFKDPTATRENYMGGKGRSGIGLNETEFNWVKSFSGNKREVMIKRKSGDSIILNIDLSHLGSHLHLLRSEKEVLTAYENLKDQPDWQKILMETI